MFKSSLVALAALAWAGAASAAATLDPAGDFLATYGGAHAGDLDILSVNALNDGVNLRLSATLGGAVGASANTLYVWGINRGGGTARLAAGSPSVGAGVLFDAVAVFFPNATGRVVTLPPGLPGPPTSITPLAPGAVSVDGDTISALFPLALLPSTGFAPQDYTFTLWTRQRVNPLADGTSAEIADFGPTVTAGAPEPAAWALLVAGFGLAGGAARRRKAALA
jgi:hypothetical protein